MMGESARMAPSRTRQQLLVLLRERGAMSRAELARASGLSSTSTVSTAITELAASGAVVEGGDAVRPAGRGAGRPGRAVALNPRAGAAVGIYLGFRHVRVVVADLAHRVLGSAVRELPEHTAERGLPAAVDAVEEALRSGSVYRDRLLGAGVGMPGPIHRRSGTPSPSNILPGWAGVHVAEELAERLGVPVAVDNESNLEALAELIWGAGSGMTDLLYLKLHSGVGAGVVVNGQLARGRRLCAGEVGHTILETACRVLLRQPRLPADLHQHRRRARRGGARQRPRTKPARAARRRRRWRPCRGASARSRGRARGRDDGRRLQRAEPAPGRRRGRARSGRRGTDRPAAQRAPRPQPAARRQQHRSRRRRVGMQAGALGGVALVLREGERLVPPGPAPQRPRSS